MKREVRWEGDMEGIMDLSEGCFCQLGWERRERRENSVDAFEQRDLERAKEGLLVLILDIEMMSIIVVEL